jgi:hemerythrin-like domain-containing protein
VHTALRNGAADLADAVGTIHPSDRRRRNALVRYWKGYAEELHNHHTVEDAVYFPALRERVANANRLIDRTDSEHERLSELIDRCTEGVAALSASPTAGPEALTSGLRDLASCIDSHLGFEDVEVLPLFAQHFTTEEYVALEEQAFKSVKVGPQAAFTVPFIAEAVDQATRSHILATAPAAFRIVYRLTRRRFVRLQHDLVAASGRDPVPATT